MEILGLIGIILLIILLNRPPKCPQCKQARTKKVGNEVLSETQKYVRQGGKVQLMDITVGRTWFQCPKCGYETYKNFKDEKKV